VALFDFSMTTRQKKIFFPIWGGIALLYLAAHVGERSPAMQAEYDAANARKAAHTESRAPAMQAEYDAADARKAAYTEALHKCWSEANHKAERRGYKPAPVIGQDNLNLRNLNLTADEIIEEKQCEAGARLDAMSPEERRHYARRILGID
jgi:hypothetical protein